MQKMLYLYPNLLPNALLGLQLLDGGHRDHFMRKKRHVTRGKMPIFLRTLTEPEAESQLNRESC